MKLNAITLICILLLIGAVGKSAQIGSRTATVVKGSAYEREESLRKKRELFEDISKRAELQLINLPRGIGWWVPHLVQFQGFWISPTLALSALEFIQNFRPRGDDIMLATSPKCGTTWARALIFATINRHTYDFDSHPLLLHNPQYLVPFFETEVLQESSCSNPLEAMASPRFLSTHMPYALLSDPIKASSCKVVYVCRDPKDAFISKWHFTKKMRSKEQQPLSLEDAFQLFCNGVSHYGPFWDHVLSFWNASRERPDHVMILTYEDLKRNPNVHVKKIAEFLGVPFMLEEEGQGVVDRIVKLCSFENLSNLEVNKSIGKSDYVKNPFFFRKGEVGDWKNYLTPEMAARIDEITKEKFGGCGLDLFM